MKNGSMKPRENFKGKKNLNGTYQSQGCERVRMLLIGSPMLTTSNGFGKGANSSCQTLAALRRAAEST